MSTRLGTLTLDLVAKIGNFLPPMDKSQKKLKDFGKEAANMAKVAGAAFGTLAVAGGAMFVKLTKDGLAAVDAQAKVARSLDTTYDSITALGMAFGDAGIDNFEASLNRLNRRLGAAELGRGAALKAVQELNLNLTELSKIPADERLAVIADRIREVSTNSQTAARYAQDLGFEQRQAAQFFLQGGDAIRAYSEQVDRLGLSLSDVDAAQVERAVSAMGVFGDITRSVQQRLAARSAPYLEHVLSLLEENISKSGGLAEITDGVFDGLIISADALIKYYTALGRVLSGVYELIRFIDEQSRISFSGTGLNSNITQMIKNTYGALTGSGAIAEDVANAQRERDARWNNIKELFTEPLPSLLDVDTTAQGAALVNTLGDINDEIEKLNNLPEFDFGDVVKIEAPEQIATVDLIAKRYEELQKIAERTSQSLRTPQEIFQQEIELLNELRATRQSNSDEMLISQQDYMRGVEAAQERLAQSTKETEEEMSQFAKQAARNMQDSFADFLFDPLEKGLDGLLQSFVQTLQRMAAEAAAANIFEGIGGALGGSTGAVGSFFSSVFGGARANGGPVDSNKTYLVGERGPELFSPSSNGYITKSSDLTQGAVSGGDVIVNVAVDAKGETTASSDNQGAQLGRLIAASVKSILIEEKRPGGLLNG